MFCETSSCSLWPRVFLHQLQDIIGGFSFPLVNFSSKLQFSKTSPFSPSHAGEFILTEHHVKQYDICPEH